MIYTKYITAAMCIMCITQENSMMHMTCVCILIYEVGDSCYVMAGLYAKGTPKGGYPSHLMTGPPKAASVHEMDMTPSQPGPGAGPGAGAGAAKRRNRAGRNHTAQNWGDAGMPFMGMPGRFHPEPSPQVCQPIEAVITNP